MAPVICLPIEMSRPASTKRWADVVEDSGTPSPWPDYALPDFKQQQHLWDATPSPSHAIARPMQSSAAPLDLLLQDNRGSHFDFEQTCPSLSEKAPAQMGFGSGPYVVLAQPCAVFQEMPMQCVTGRVGLPSQQQHFPGYEADLTLHNVNESMVMQTPQPWGCKFENINIIPEGGYNCGMQWAGSFAIPQQNNTQVSLQQQRWPNIEEMSTPAHFEAQLPLMPSMSPMSATADKLAESSKSKHEKGECQPCAWFWRPNGCKNGDACGYCHKCPEGELKARKKNKVAAMRMGALTPVQPNAQTSGGWGLKLDSLVQGG